MQKLKIDSNIKIISVKNPRKQKNYCKNEWNSKGIKRIFIRKEKNQWTIFQCFIAKWTTNEPTIKGLLRAIKSKNNQ